MTRHAGPRFARALVAAACLLLLGGSTVSAHHGVGIADPRCAPGYPVEPGVDLGALCQVREPQGRPGDLDGGATALIPIIVGMLVTGVLLALVAVIALKVRPKPVARSTRTAPKAWWMCPACHSMNGAGRALCYSCQSPAPAAIAAGAAATTIDTTAPPAPVGADATPPPLDQPVGRPAG